ncbi:MAG: hypothetical protein ACRC10_02775 [Thermoguttaceae bacterium]
MAIHLRCPNGHHLTAKETNAGKVGKCPVCKALVQIESVRPEVLSESAVLDILGRPEPRTMSSARLVPNAIAQRPAATLGQRIVSSTLPTYKSCPNCERDIDVGYHICPHCHTYLTGLREF